MKCQDEVLELRKKKQLYHHCHGYKYALVSAHFSITTSHKKNNKYKQIKWQIISEI